MRPLFLGVGRLLGSVAMRYRHPCAMGVQFDLLSRASRGSRLPIGPVDDHNGGGCERRSDRLARLEAVFFLSRQPQTSRKLAQLAGLADGTKARTLARTLNRRYDAEGSAFRVEEVAGGFQLMTRSKFAPWLRRLHAAPAEVRLSAPAMETLAVVAYQQPVLRADIEAIRGVQSGEVLRQLIERDLVRITGRSDELGRPFLYGTTKYFLQVFGLRHLDELPNQFNPSPVAEEEVNVKTVAITQPRRPALAEEQCPTAIRPRHGDRPGRQNVFDKLDEGEDAPEDDKDELDEEEDFDDDFEDEEDEEDDDDDLDDEPWEEVEEEEEEEDEDFDDDDDDWEEDEDWEDEDWDDEDEDWEDDEEEEEEEKKKE